LKTSILHWWAKETFFSKHKQNQ